MRFENGCSGDCIGVAVSVTPDTYRPGFYRREAVPAQTMLGMTAFYAAWSDLPPLSGGHRLSEPGKVGSVSHCTVLVWMWNLAVLSIYRP